MEAEGSVDGGAAVDEGAKATQGVEELAKLNGIEPFEWLRDVLTCMIGTCMIGTCEA